MRLCLTLVVMIVVLWFDCGYLFCIVLYCFIIWLFTCIGWFVIDWIWVCVLVYDVCLLG